MSWDLYVLPRERAVDSHDWLEEIAESPGDAAVAAEHAAAIRARRPELGASDPAEDGTVELWTPEDSELPLQVLLDGRHGAVSVAYWDLGERTEQLVGLLVDVVGALTDATGWVPFDPQEDRVVALDELGESFRSGHAYGAELVREIVGRELPNEEPTEAPRRRRGLFGWFRR